MKWLESGARCINDKLDSLKLKLIRKYYGFNIRNSESTVEPSTPSFIGAIVNF